MTTKAIDVSGLTKRFGSFTAVDHITFHVDRGEIFGFLGANGAGKTTAMRMLCGLSKPSAGNGTVAGCDIRTEGEQIKRHIGYMSQRFSLYGGLNVNENLRLFATIYGLGPEQYAARSAELFDELKMPAEVRVQPVSSLPVGWRQKLAFAAATIHRPEVLFLDEPTGGVDPLTRRRFWELIYQSASEGMTVFVTTHYLDEAEYCNRISIMTDGKIAAMGTPDELKREYRSADINEVFRKVAATSKYQE